MNDAVRLNDLAARGPFGRSKLYEFVRTGELPARKRGGTTFVLEADWRAFLAEAPLAVVARQRSAA